MRPILSEIMKWNRFERISKYHYKRGAEEIKNFKKTNDNTYKYMIKKESKFEAHYFEDLLVILADNGIIHYDPEYPNKLSNKLIAEDFKETQKGYYEKGNIRIKIMSGKTTIMNKHTGDNMAFSNKNGELILRILEVVE